MRKTLKKAGERDTGAAEPDVRQTYQETVMRKTKVRIDAKSLFVVTGGYLARPGKVAGYDHAYEMDEGGLRCGDEVKARHLAGSPLIKLMLADGRLLHWHVEER